MRVESISNAVRNIPKAGKNNGKVIAIEDIRSILFLGISGEIRTSENKRKVDIII